MHDARDAEDRRLLEAGEHKLLLSAYVQQIRDRCFFKLLDRDAGDEIAQRIFLRLWSELCVGKTYGGLPYRVVVAMVTDWELRGFYPPAKQDAELPEQWDELAPDAFAAWEADHDLALLFADLSDGDRRVLELRYRLGLEPGDIAQELGIKANAVYQALFRGHQKLKAILDG
jgi:DNA-directed RNA polymerase specialized sigma24 family protein